MHFYEIKRFISVDTNSTNISKNGMKFGSILNEEVTPKIPKKKQKKGILGFFGCFDVYF